MTPAHELDADRARSPFERKLIEAKNAGKSWPTIARELDVSVRIARDAWGRANAHQRGDEHQSATDEIPARWIGDAELLRGVPLFVPGIRFGGAINGTRPGDPSWQLDRDRRPSTKVTRRASLDADPLRKRSGEGSAHSPTYPPSQP